MAIGERFSLLVPRRRQSHASFRAVLTFSTQFLNLLSEYFYF